MLCFHYSGLDSRGIRFRWKPLFECGASDETITGLRNPGDLVADAAGRIQLSDNYHHRHVGFSPEGKVPTTMGERGTGGLNSNYANGADVAENGGLFLGDWTGGRILKVAVGVHIP